MTGNQEIFQKIMNLGHSAAWDQLWDRAATYYRQALEEIPDHPQALSHLGLALFELKDYSNALKVYLRAVKVSAQDPSSYEKIGRIYEYLNRNNEASQAYIQAADYYLKARDVEKSIELYLQVLRIQENLVARTRLAMIYDRLGRKPEAVAEYLAAASLMQQRGEMVKALQVVEYAQQILPQNLEVQQALLMLKNNQSLPRPNRPRMTQPSVRPNESPQLPLPNQNVKPPDPIGEARQMALVQLASVLFDQAEETNTESQVSRRGISSLTRGSGGLSTSQSDRTRILLHLGQAIDSQTRNEDAQAAEELERSIDAGLKHPAAQFNAGLLFHSRDPQKALRYLQESVKNPDFALASYLLIGHARRLIGQQAEAAAAYLQALRIADAETVPPSQADELRQLYEPVIESLTGETDPARLTALCETIQNHLVRPDWRAYLKLARQQLQPQQDGTLPMPLAEMMLESRSGQVIEALAHVRVLASQNKLPSAMEEAYHAVQYAPTYLPLHIQIGELLLKEGHVQDAVDKFLLIAELYSLRGESNQAIRLFNRIIEITPMNISVRSRLIDLLLAQGKTDIALQQYISLAEIQYQLAELDKSRQTYLSALRLAQQAHSPHPVLIQLLYKIADIDMQFLDWRSALRVYEQIRNLDPEDNHGRARLVEMNFRMGQESAALNEIDGYLALLGNSRQQDKAIEFLQEILNDQPDKPDVHERFARLLQKSGQTQLAIHQFDVASTQYLDLGNRPAALQALKSIIELNPPNAEIYQERLEQIRRSN